MQFHYFCDQIYFLLICSIINQVSWCMILTMILHLKIWRTSSLGYVSFAAVFRDVTQRSALPFGGALRDIPKDGCEGDHTRLALIHSYKTRAAVAVNFMLFIHKPNSRTNLCQIWNKIPKLFNQNQNNYSKKHLQTKLLKFLVYEKVHVDVYNLADKLFFISS